MMTFDVLETPNASVTVAELDANLTPQGLALELHLVRLGSESFAFWLLEDGRMLQLVAIGQG
jgi:hypothetical protein